MIAVYSPNNHISGSFSLTTMTPMPVITARMREVSRLRPPSWVIASTETNLSLVAFLSWLRLSIYMAIVSVAIMISFHLKNQPTDIERKVSVPFGVVFWLLSLACLTSGLSNYIKTVSKYSQRQALVQTGWKTQVVCLTNLSTKCAKCSNKTQIFTVVASAIVAACILFLSTNAMTK